jgi:CubicO group peptidase (beta-lactamase class C family)
VKPPPAVAAALDAVLEPWNRPDAPGGAAAVRSIDGWVWRRAVGAADVQSRVVNSLQTRFRIGSITKQFLAAVVFELAREGRLDLDASIRTYLPELSDGLDPVRVIHLTDHTSGIWCHITTGLLVNGRGLYPPPSGEEVFDLVAGQRRPAFPPGSHTSYSNGGSVLLTRIVEMVERKSLEDVFQDRLFGPLGMTATSLVRTDSALEPGLAVCHVPLPDGRYERGYMPVTMGGEGAAVSTLDDMLVWLAELESHGVLDPSIGARMDTPVRLATGHEPNFRRGMLRARYRGHDILYHDGGVVGGMARAGRIPSLGLQFIAFGNRADFFLNPVSRALIEAAGGDRLTEPAPTRPAQAWAGAYHRPGSARVVTFEAREAVAMVDVNGQPAPLVIDGEEQRCDTTETADLSFRLSRDGSVLTVDDRGERDELARLPDAYAPAGAEVDALLGDYACEDLHATAKVARDDDGPTVEMRGPLGCRRYRLKPVGPRVWRMDATDPPTSRASSPILEAMDGGFRVGTFRVIVDFVRRS